MKRRIILIITSIFLTITLLFTSTACLSKKTETATTPTPIEQLQTRAASLESKVASLVEQVSALRTQVPPNLQPAIDQLKADLTTISTKIAQLEVRIAELETEKEAVTSGDVDPEDAIEVSLMYLPSVSTTIGSNSISAPLKLKLENLLNVAIEDIELYAIVQTTPSTLTKIASNSGSSVIAAGENSVVVTHGLGVAPAPADIQITPLTSLSSGVTLTVDTISTTTFIVRISVAQTTSTTFSWTATGTKVVAITSVSITGDLTWQSYGTNAFINWDLPKLKALERGTFNQTITVTFSESITANTIPNTLQFSVRVVPQDYEVTR